jgi:hypothetical protein
MPGGPQWSRRKLLGNMLGAGVVAATAPVVTSGVDSAAASETPAAVAIPLATRRQLRNEIALPPNWNSGAWFAAKAHQKSNPAWIAFLGDSITGGSSPSAGGFIGIGFPDLVRTGLLHDGNMLYGDFYSPWAYSQSTGPVIPENPVYEGFPDTVGTDAAEGCFGEVLGMGATTNTYAQTISTGNIPGWTAGNCTGFDIVYFDFSAGTWQFLIDGGQGGSPTVTGASWNGSAWQVVNSGGGYTSGEMKKVTVRGLTSGQHTIDWGYQSASAVFYLAGISLYTGNSGLGFVRAGWYGRRLVDLATPIGATTGFGGTFPSFPQDKISLWSGVTTPTTRQISPSPFGFPMQPSAVVVSYGINDCGSGINPQQFDMVLRRLIASLRRGATNCNIIIQAVSNPDPYVTDNNNAAEQPLAERPFAWPLYKDLLQATADTYGCAYIDVDARWGSTPVADGMMVNENVHPTSAGYADMASYLLAIL